jgi:purine nucleosidase
MVRRIIIDCDPGQDDAVALFLAMASPEELDILGITAVAGNVPLDLTQRNVRQMCDIAGRTDMRVFAGCDRPMVRELLTAEKVHGNTGIDSVTVIDPVTPLQDQHALDFIVDTLRATPGPRSSNSSSWVVPCAKAATTRRRRNSISS